MLGGFALMRHPTVFWSLLLLFLAVLSVHNAGRLEPDQNPARFLGQTLFLIHMYTGSTK